MRGGLRWESRRGLALGLALGIGTSICPVAHSFKGRPCRPGHDCICGKSLPPLWISSTLRRGSNQVRGFSTRWGGRHLVDLLHHWIVDPVGVKHRFLPHVHLQVVLLSLPGGGRALHQTGRAWVKSYGCCGLHWVVFALNDDVQVDGFPLGGFEIEIEHLVEPFVQVPLGVSNLGQGQR